ncbi:hypothetical protein DFS34DRAFT_592854 [Phlyctochytrium arcticum]|nr:hypothetical protein DFS34DRAFT_592854 [Phlyctochytrium arcticum]
MVLVLELRRLSIVEQGAGGRLLSFGFKQTCHLKLEQPAAYLLVLVKKQPPESLSHTSYVQKQPLFTPEKQRTFQQRSLFTTASGKPVPLEPPIGPEHKAIRSQTDWPTICCYCPNPPLHSRKTDIRWQTL